MNVQNFSFVTLEYLEAYGNRLRWNLALNIPINGLASFLVLKYSTPAMGIYKYFILATIVSAFIMDFHSSFIYGLYNFMPYPIGCPTGITRNLGWFWGSAVNFTTFQFTMSFCGLSLTYSIIYQYFSLTKDTEIFHKPKTIIAIFASVILYPIPSAILYINSYDHEAGKKFVYANFPDIAKVFDAGSCGAHILSSTIYIYFIVASFQVFVVFTFAVIIGIILAFKLEKLKHSLSAATLKAHKQYIYALYIQGTVPLLFIVIPVIFMIFTVIFNIGNAQDAFEWAFQCFGLHSCGNAIAVIYIIKPYRNALIQWFQKLSGIFYKKSNVKIIASNSATSVNIISSTVIKN